MKTEQKEAEASGEKAAGRMKNEEIGGQQREPGRVRVALAKAQGRQKAEL
jgi:hypothetical protein